jgi:hypothetical protein
MEEKNEAMFEDSTMLRYQTTQGKDFLEEEGKGRDTFQVRWDNHPSKSA